MLGCWSGVIDGFFLTLFDTYKLSSFFKFLVVSVLLLCICLIDDVFVFIGCELSKLVVVYLVVALVADVAS